MTLLQIDKLIQAIDNHDYFLINYDYSLKITYDKNKYYIEFNFRDVLKDTISFYKDELVTFFEALVGVREGIYKNISLSDNRKSKYESITISKIYGLMSIKIKFNTYKDITIASERDEPFEIITKAISYILIQDMVESNCKELQDE